MLAALQRVTDAALSFLPEQELLQELLERISELMAVDTVAILLVDGDTLLARAAKGIEEEVDRGVRIPLGRGFAGRIAAERRAIILPDVDHADILNPILRERGIRSLLGVPLLVQSESIGVLHVGSLTPRTFTDDERNLLQTAADRAAIAIERTSVHEQRQVAESLQRRLLPPPTPDIAGLDVAARYRPAAGGRLGGDWYDIFPLAGGRVAVAVGDVVGHGVESAAGMAQLRTALRAYAVDGLPPAEAVEHVNHLMWHVGPLMMTTLAFLVIDAGRETAEMVNAGHPPPLVIEPQGGTRFVEEPHGVALGASAAASYTGTSPAVPGRIDGAALHGRAGRAPRRAAGRRAGAAPAPRGGRVGRGAAVHRDRRAPRRPVADRRRRLHRRAQHAARRPAAPRLAGALGEPRPDPPAAAPLAARPRRERQRDLRHHRRLPGGMHERDRARVRARPGGLRGRRRVRDPARADRRPRQRALAPGARREPRPRPAPHARPDGDGRGRPDARGHPGHAGRALEAAV